MCGIAGIVRFDDQPIAPVRLEAMLERLRHRGPDGQGMAVNGRCGLVHTRLAILDPARGQQPMGLDARGKQGPLLVVFNGEIYNHRDLRRRLEGLGHQFRSDHCDTEVLLHGYRAWGEKLPEQLEGMFAFALWDAQNRRLFLARDRAGKKPLYLRAAPGAPGEVIFASDVATIVEGLPSGESPQVCQAAMADFLLLGYPGLRAMVDGVEELAPAHALTIDAAGHRTTRTYWQLATPVEPAPAEGILEHTRQTIAAAVSARLEADAPLGCFLSGGIDSSLVAALAQAALQERGQGPLRTFSVAMPQADYDESSHARTVALHLGTRHTELLAQPALSLLGDLMTINATSGEPTADSSILPTYWLSQATRQHVAVALSGDGGDELFAGYDRYRAMRLLTRQRYWLRHLPGVLLASGNPRSHRTRLRRLVTAARASSQSGQYRSMIHLFTQRQLAGLWPDGMALVGAAAELDAWHDAPDPAAAAMRWDFHHYLPFDLLRKVDRASMAVALEVRCPLLDSSVCALAAGLPAAALTPGGRPKGLLRAVAAPLLPAGIINRPKRGFALPLGRWFRRRLRRTLRDELLDTPLFDLGLKHDQVIRLEAEHARGRADHTHRLFALLSLTVWERWRRYRARERAAR